MYGGSGSTEGSARYRHQSQRVRTLRRVAEAAREGTPQNVRFDTPFLTCERLQSIKINFFIEKTGNDISEEDAQLYSEEDEKMVWMREARIRTFMQLELETCLEEINWMIRCHNCETLNRPQEEHPARPLLIPPYYIDNLQSRLTKVKKGIFPPTLKMIIKTYYPPPARPAPRTSVQPDDTMGGHRDGENSPQERPQASEEEEKVVANDTPSVDEGVDFIFRTEVGTDNEATQLADRHFELAILRQQGTTAQTTDCEGDYDIQVDFRENSNTATAAQVAAREEAAIGQHRQGTASTDQNKQYNPAGRVLISSFPPSGRAVCMLCCACLFFPVLSSLHFPMLSCQVMKAARIIL